MQAPWREEKEAEQSGRGGAGVISLIKQVSDLLQCWRVAALQLSLSIWVRSKR